jgi:hypothetical protein
MGQFIKKLADGILSGAALTGLARSNGYFDLEGYLGLDSDED